jgi:hypothetical protein
MPAGVLFLGQRPHCETPLAIGRDAPGLSARRGCRGARAAARRRSTFGRRCRSRTDVLDEPRKRTGGPGDVAVDGRAGPGGAELASDQRLPGERECPSVTRWARAGELTTIYMLGGHRRCRLNEVFALRARHTKRRRRVAKGCESTNCSAPRDRGKSVGGLIF